MRLLALCLTAFVAACSSAAAPTPAAPSPTAAAPQAAASAPPAAPAPDAPPAPSTAAVTEAEARALLDTWLLAQNTGDFATYDQLYAKRFDGIKRVGERVRKYDRAGWIEDRARMFRRPTSGDPMRVTLTDTVVTASGSTARVRFVQAFSRGGFSDRGPKELLLVQQDGELRIAREELLSSEVLSRSAMLDAAAPGQFFFVMDEGVLLSSLVSRDAATGPLELLEGSADIFVVRSAVDEARLGAGERSMKGRTLQLNGRPECTARVGALSLLVRVDPHFGTTMHWAGIEVNDAGELVETGNKTPAEEIAREVWEMGDPVLLGALEGVPSHCEAAFARDAALPTPVVVDSERESSAAVEREVLREVKKGILAFAPVEGDAPTNESIDIRRVPGKHPLVVARYSRGEGCSDFVSATFIWSLLGTEPKVRLKLLNDPKSSLDLSVGMGLDLDGDGYFELMSSDGNHLVRPADAYSRVESVPLTELDCYC
jgi:hypothetical protein